MYIQTNLGLGQITTSLDINKAIRNNRIYSQQLGWQKNYNEIVKFFGLITKPNDAEFAQAVAQWQQNQGMKPDGIVGPSTWKALQSAIIQIPSSVNTQSRADLRSIPQQVLPLSSGRVLTYTPQDVIDNRISVPAQHSLVRLSKNPATSADAVGMLEEVKVGRLAGIYCVNWKPSAQRALKFGKSWWTVIPQGEDAILMLDPDDPLNGQPLIAFRRELSPVCGSLKSDIICEPGTACRSRITPSPARLDEALLKAWSSYKVLHRNRQTNVGTGQGVQCIIKSQSGDGVLAGTQIQRLPSVLSLNNVVPSLLCKLRTGTTFLTKFTPGVNHNHKPTFRWSDVQKDAKTSCKRGVIDIFKDLKEPSKLSIQDLEEISNCACAPLSPEAVGQFALKLFQAMLLPLAAKHLKHYLDGSGGDLWVDLEDIVRRDSKFRNKLSARVKRSRRGFLKIQQGDYAVRDFLLAIGAIDRLDFEVDKASGLVHIWFMDRYEWHPWGFGYKPLPGDHRRKDNCVHAAMVELKSSGAKDYWMKGDVVVRLSDIVYP